ncbi:DUF3581 domain-containing protein [Thiomicrorhabdus lithotrophica]|uniref:DUF3581 domain-containing protein n=1 Tax=Thiomicrorhabdus lithotrophica TaxID=2949997 RepID=A0ABY8CFJ5_9GAMM|nr:DUF3581 domain-containing protein [Thiomicrorhabdus lithotrophica]WEJ63562.1 DUF3581 domain-containing protein [Thiomicrorhabdus lithotrophica]
MYLDDFHSIHNDLIIITPEQGSRFAKEVSDDFNPLHNPDSKRFCVPGDLLFAMTLARFGLSEKMTFNYTGMVGKGVELVFPKSADNNFIIKDNNDKAYLDISREGNISDDMNFIEGFSRAYVAFSGHSFPHILVPLMKQHNVMINPDRPMVIYESMAFEFDNLEVNKPSLKLSNTSLEVEGKRGTVRIEFDVLDDDTKVGSGYKTMVLSGLREYDQAKVDGLIDLYETSKSSYVA